MRSARSKPVWGPVAAVVLLVVLGAALRIYRLDSGLWYDEITTLVVSVRPALSTILTSFPGNNDHPFYSVLAHLSVTLFGEHPWSLRLPALIFGIAAIPMLYRMGTAVTSRFEAVLATSILTVSYHHIWFSQNARAYSALLFCVLVCTLLLVQWFEDGRKSRLAAYAVVAAIGTYFHMSMALVAVSHAFVCAGELLRNKNSSRSSRDWLPLAATFVGAAFLTILLYSPMLLDVHDFFATNNSTSRADFATPLWAFVAALRGLQVGFGSAWVISAGAVLFGAGLWSYYKQSSRTLYLFLLPGPVTLAAAVVIGQPVRPRFFFLLMGFCLLITVRGATAIGVWMGERTSNRMVSQSLGMAMSLLLTVGAIAFCLRSLPYGYRYPKQDYAGAIAFVEQNKKEPDVVAVVGTTGAMPIQDYFGRPWPRIDLGDQLRELRTKGNGVWVLYTFKEYIQENDPEFWTMLQKECQEVREFEGTIAGGNIDVCRCPPMDIAAARTDTRFD